MQEYIFTILQGIITSSFFILSVLFIILGTGIILLWKKKILSKIIFFSSTAGVILGLLFILPRCSISEINYGHAIASLPLIRIIQKQSKSKKPMMENASLSREVAMAYDVKAFNKVKSIHYTFNVDFNGKKMSRSWEWFPKTKEITYWGKNSKGKEVKVTYNEHKMDNKIKKIDAKFINDNYWLLFPFHLVWDTNVKFQDLGIKKYPIGKGSGKAIMVDYSDKVGYTPGDHFELFLGKNDMVRQWIYFHHGSTKHPFPAVWEGNKNFDGFTISTMHFGPHKKFKLWFSNIKVSLVK